jgi:hypothetical protein
MLSCSSYLDVIPDNIPTIEHSFSNRYQAEAYLYGCFSFLPNFADAGSNPGLLGGDEAWHIDPTSAYGISSVLWYIARGTQGTNAPLADYWASKQNGYNLQGGKATFTALSDCNIFLENIHKPFDLDDEERNRWIAEIKFLKAYYHFWLFRMYGPIPVIRENISINSPGEIVQRYREPVDEVVQHIVSLIDEAVVNLPTVITDKVNEMGRPTKAIALAIKAQALTLAASPLFNGTENEKPVFSLIDNRGIELFPQTYSREKWEKAAVALKEAIDEAGRAEHKLYDFKTYNPNYASLSDATTLSMQVRGAVTERWNSEIIWGDPNTSAGTLQHGCFPAITISHVGDGEHRATYAPTLRAVEQFYTKNGIPIEDDSDWTGIDPYSLRTATADDRFYIQQNTKTIQLHFDREARFYASIIFDRGRFFGNSRLTDDNLLYIQLKAGTPGAGAMDRHSSTGYLCKKLIHIMTSGPDAGGLTNYQYAFPVIRLADLYLMYAEALNESGGETPSSEVYKYIDSIRTRTGLKGVIASWRDHAVDSKKNKPLSKTGMRDIIRRERMNELAFEGIRFWDLRRWKLSEEYMNRPIRGMNITGETDEDFYKVTEIFPLKFEKKDYLWPIRQSVLLSNNNLKQNPGW